MQRTGWAWIHAAADAELEARLRAELARLRGASAAAALGVAEDAGADAVRAAFLQATKELHPTRFARRSREIVRLANEVFLLLKSAYQERSRPSPRARVATPSPGMPVPGTQVRREPGRAGTARAAAPAEPAARPARGNQTVSELSPSVDHELGQALSLCERGQWSEGLLALQMLAVRHPRDTHVRAYVHYAQGRERASLGDVTLARAEYERALAIEPAFEMARRALDALLAARQTTSPRRTH